MRPVYLDYNATTPLDPAVRRAMQPFLDEIWGNPSSVHQLGRRARVALDDARQRAAAVLRCQPGEVTFTSGGTESNNLAILGSARRLQTKGRHLITSAIEHPAVLRCFDLLEAREGFSVTRLPVDAAGRVSPDDLKRALRPDTCLVSVMAANNEIGTLQPVAELGRICRERGVVFHTDAVQWFGKEPFSSIAQFNADLVSACAHKFHGPKGAGLLFSRSPHHPLPLLVGGGHENERRAGTENLASIVGLVEALERFVPDPVFSRDALFPLSSRLLALGEDLPGIHFSGSRDSRLSNTVAFLVEGTDSIALLAALDLEGFCASAGSACSSGALSPSHVISALGVSPALARSLIRFSLGRENSSADLDCLASVLPRLLRRLQLAGKR